ncbi:MAG: hypothetical protein V2A73_08645 [Pseudomonadota bacterium]
MTINAVWTDPSDAGALDLDTDDQLTETVWDAVMSNIKRLGGTAGLLQCTDAGLLLLNDTANAKSTIGFTINQGAADNEILSLKSSDVAHAMTTNHEADTYACMKKVLATDGGLLVEGLTETTIAIGLGGRATSTNEWRNTSAEGTITVDASKNDAGGSFGTLGANQNMVVFRDHQTARFILDSDGDSHQDVGTAWTNFDDYDDVALLTALSAGVSRPGDVVRERFGQFLSANRPALEQARLVTFNDDGHHFVNMSRLTMLLVGAVRQLGDRLAETRALIESRPQALEA